MKFIQLSSAISALTAVLSTSPAWGQFTYTTLDVPGATDTIAFGIDGNNIVGRYTDSGGSFHGFLFDGTTFLTLDDPSAVTGPGLGTIAQGIRGNTIVGMYYPSPSWGEPYGFEYNWTTNNWQTLIPPGMAWGTAAHGVSGNNIVGYYADPYNYGSSTQFGLILSM